MNDIQEMDVESADPAKIKLMVHLRKSKCKSLCSLKFLLGSLHALV